MAVCLPTHYHPTVEQLCFPSATTTKAAIAKNKKNHTMQLVMSLNN